MESTQNRAMCFIFHVKMLYKFVLMKSMKPAHRYNPPEKSDRSPCDARKQTSPNPLRPEYQRHVFLEVQRPAHSYLCAALSVLTVTNMHILMLIKQAITFSAKKKKKKKKNGTLLFYSKA